jgi:EAL domain-containing protein (putative c-di-GMP-specific phosphodiesterase class I)
VTVAQRTALASSVDLVHAIDDGQLLLHYQHVIDLRTGRLDSVEALVRWAHPEMGLLHPVDFIDLAEHASVGSLLTAFVLEQAIADCAGWHYQGFPGSVSVNVSPAVLGDASLPGRVSLLLDRYHLAPDRLILEITERHRPGDATALAPTLERLAECGVRLSIDDFGIGDSSLSRLQAFPFDELKIDRSFIAGIATEATDRAIVEFTSQLAHSLGMRVVAEGVETKEALVQAQALGVDAAQGYLFNYPCCAAELGRRRR